jgi:hypothetical protein
MRFVAYNPVAPERVILAGAKNLIRGTLVVAPSGATYALTGTLRAEMLRCVEYDDLPDHLRIIH